MPMGRFEVGPQYGGTGSQNDLSRVGITGATVIADAHGHFFESVRMGLSATGQGVWNGTTVTAGVAPGTALAAAGNPIVLWNPPNSGVMAVVLASRVEYVSGTAGAGVFWYTAIQQQNVKPSAGTQTTVNANVIGSTATPRCQVWTGATVVNTPVALQPLMQITAVANTVTTFKDLLDGEFVVVPGAGLGIQEIGAAGTTPLFAFGVTWEEVPLLF